MSAAGQNSEPPSQLPRGRHGLSRGFVARNQRERILAGATTAVAQLGYARATVADIVVHARLSRRTFYEHFEDKESAVLAAFDAGLDRARAAILTAYDAHE